MVASVITTAMMARYLEPESFGRLNFVLALVSLFGLFTALGLQGILVREQVREPKASPQILGTALVLRLLAGGITYILSYGLIRLLKPADHQIALLTGIMSLSLFLQAFDTIDTWFSTQIESRYAVWIRNAASLISSGVKIWLIIIGGSLTALIWAHLLEFILIALGLIGIIQVKGLGVSRWVFDIARARFLLSQSWPLILASSAAYIYTKIDLTMLAQMASPRAVGIYSATIRLAEVFDFIPLIIHTSVLPTAVANFAQSQRHFSRFAQGIFDLMVILWLTLAVAVTIGAPFLVDLVFGSRYHDSVQLLTLYIWGLFGSCLGLARALYANVKNLYLVSLQINLIGVLVNVGLNLILIPRYEAFGATIATLITYFVTVVVLNIYFREFKPVSILIKRALQFNHSIPRLLRAIHAS